ncbi:MAG: hypothetical protein D6761_02495 [Candidatus Dadabacteria bacterium]|nr:MAG: hypothetical protein D6761_02495 [Candidatus Dadabacteria bacterium]
MSRTRKRRPGSKGRKNPASPQDLRPRVELALVLLLTLAAAILRFYKLGFRSFWRDELATIQPALNADSIWRLFLHLTPGDHSHPRLAHTLVRLSSELFGTSELALRAPAAVAGTLVVPIAWLLARRLFRTAAARLIFVAAHAFSLFVTYYSQEARMYIFAYLIALWSTERLLTWLQHPGWKEAITYALSAALLFNAHYVAIFAVVGHGLYLAIRAFLLRDLPIRRFIPQSPWNVLLFRESWSALHLMSLLLVTPLMSILIWGMQDLSRSFWLWDPNAKMIADVLLMYLGFKAPPFAQFGWSSQNLALVLPLVTAAVATAIAVIRYVKSAWIERPQRDQHIRPALLALCWFGCAFGIPLMISAFSSLNVFMARTVMTAMAPFWILLILPVERWRQPWLSGLLAIVLVAPSLASMHWYYNAPHKPAWRDAVAWIEQQAQPGDYVLQHNRPFYFYSKLGKDRLKPVRTRSPVLLDQDLRQARRIWVIRELWAGDSQTRKVIPQLARYGFRPTHQKEFAGLAVFLVERVPDHGTPQ